MRRVSGSRPVENQEGIVMTASEPPVTPPQPTLAETSVAAHDLRSGDLIMYGGIFGPYRVVDNAPITQHGHVLARSRITLEDASGTRHDFLFSSTRVMSKVEPSDHPLMAWVAQTEHGFKDMARDDSPIGKAIRVVLIPAREATRRVLDLQCYVHSLRFFTGFIGIVLVICLFATGLIKLLPASSTVAVSIVGAFIVERVWHSWRRRLRRQLYDRLAMRIKYKPFGYKRYRYGKITITQTGALIVDEGLRPWSSTQLQLSRSGTVLATCTLANRIKGDQRVTCRDIADAIRHRITDGSRRMLYTSSTKHVPADGSLPDITITPRGKGRYSSIWIPDENERHKKFSLLLLDYQMLMFADALEVMDDGRRL